MGHRSNNVPKMIIDPTTDRRQRSKQAVLSAFVSLLVEKRYDEIQTREIARRANVGRSTFYRHFRNKEDLLESSVRWLPVAIADASLRQDSSHTLTAIIDHLWANRRLARLMSRPSILRKLRRALTAELESRLLHIQPIAKETLAAHRAVQIAGAQLAFLEAWLNGEITASRDQAVERIVAATAI
jgi:AcrR family transcriptional regulator